MKVRLPLYAKILGWFFLNVVALVAVVALLFNAQFLFDVDWLLASGARQRIEAVKNLIVGELNTTPPDQWPEVIDRYNDAYDIRFSVYDDEGNPLLGREGPLPPRVRERILRRPDAPSLGQAEAPGDASATPRRRGPRPPLRALVRTANPTEYWLLASARLDNPQAGGAMRVILVGKSSTLSGGGLVFDVRPWIALALGAVIFSLLFWLPLVRGITRSVARMQSATRQIAEGQFDVRVPARRRDELGSLGAAINQMASRLNGVMSGQKRFLGDVAHELCSPLARLQMALGVLAQRATREQSSHVQSAMEKAEQIASLVGELLSFSKASFGPVTVQLKPVHLRQIAETAVHHEVTEGADIRLDVPEDIFVAGDPDLLTRALSNLLRNALRHAKTAGTITIMARRARDEIEVVVSDSGPGVPAEELPRIFDAFYRLDASRTRDTGGTGLGLAIVKHCVEACGGTVTARNRQPHGLDVVLRLPLWAEHPPSEEEMRPGRGAPRADRSMSIKQRANPCPQTPNV